MENEVDMCGTVRLQPEGNDDSPVDTCESLDPRVEIELEKLNSASNDINLLEKELDEARAVFRQKLTDAARDLRQLAKSLGNKIDKARPYFEALAQTKKAQEECSNVAMTYERACDLHKNARKAIAVAEEKFIHNPAMFDPAWQETLNSANQQLLMAEGEKLNHEEAHHEAALAYSQLEQRKTQLERELKKSINKARPYFEQKSQYLGYLETQKVRVQALEASYATAKSRYSKSLRELEHISEEIHRKRSRSEVHSQKREACVGEERPAGISRRISEESMKQLLKTSKHSRSGRYRSSLLLDLDVDFDIGDSIDSSFSPKSPSTKSVDMGCVSMKYYDDYQVLDVSPFVERERLRRRWSGRVKDSQRSSVISSDFSDVDAPASLQESSRSDFEVIESLEQSRQPSRQTRVPVIEEEKTDETP